MKSVIISTEQKNLLAAVNAQTFFSEALGTWRSLEKSAETESAEFKQFLNFV